MAKRFVVFSGSPGLEPGPQPPVILSEKLRKTLLIRVRSPGGQKHLSFSVSIDKEAAGLGLRACSHMFWMILQAEDGIPTGRFVAYLVYMWWGT